MKDLEGSPEKRQEVRANFEAEKFSLKILLVDQMVRNKLFSANIAQNGKQPPPSQTHQMSLNLLRLGYLGTSKISSRMLVLRRISNLDSDHLMQ